MSRRGFKVGDRVFTRYKYHGTRRLGTVSHTNGPMLIYVSLDYLQTGCDDHKKDVEVYPCEIDLVDEEKEDERIDPCLCPVVAHEL